MKTVQIFTDGSCKGNPGPGGWCAILRYNGNEKVLSGGEKNTTNNRMELSAVLFALKALKEPCRNKYIRNKPFSGTDGGNKSAGTVSGTV